MHVTRVFKSGNSQAVRIPAELAYSEIGTDLQITRLGDVITIFPVRKSLKDLLPRFVPCRSRPASKHTNRSSSPSAIDPWRI
jgi:antitoxin VapB